ncbi:glycoside hydrolase family 127 protein [Bifidobacterium callimiconis]|uniref:Cytosolic protein n=1 Tax=Bifidobacterium callimiconis TaxID=2306973 RepID=A0A430FB37_9BIFI|nr:glycoside hydrolase family 127 protein [Bifidobacterium callimiconis]MBT1177735.1 glycoside hydrolase family 127 protein [Bifidobacterium callimiconis]RSX50057.1 cytosolic protein [Bifidobacterium callimiconis]
MSTTTVKVTSPFWTRYRENVAKEVIPYQWSVINDEREIDIPEDPSGAKQDIDNHYSRAVRNLRIAAGDEEGPFKGFVFQDSDVYKWLEEAAYALAYTNDADLRELCDSLVDLIARAQREDGYLDTPYIIKSGAFETRERFTQIQQSHEMYVMGHYIEAAVAYYEVTGNEQALDVARKMADCLDANFGPEDGKIHGSDGHPEIELALARLYEVTGEQRYLTLSKFFIDVRGQDPAFYDKQNAKIGNGSTDIFPQMRGWTHEYTQSARPIRRQQTAEGHAVRVVYLLTAVAHVARLTKDAELVETAQRLWEDIVRRRMYITGGIGSTHIGEAFTYDYDLPNETMYGESCASVGLSFVARQMLDIAPRGEYADVLEKEIFNGGISGIALDGKHFYYVNPLEADPKASAHNPDQAHVLMHRAEWFGCACCPANIARFIASIDRYLYNVRESDRTIVAHQFIANEAEFFDGVKVVQESDFPWDGDVRFTVTVPKGVEGVRFLVRIPSWSAGRYTLTVNGADAADLPVNDGFVTVEVASGTAVVIRLGLDMRVKFMRSKNAVRQDAGKVAVMRGPVVYCAEEADNEGPLWNYRLSAAAVSGATAEYRSDELDGVTVLTVPAAKRVDEEADAPLYADVAAGIAAPTQATLKLIPYYAWANREVGQMQVWFDSDF